MNVADLKTGQMAIVAQVLNISLEQGRVQRLAVMGDFPCNFPTR